VLEKKLLTLMQKPIGSIDDIVVKGPIPCYECAMHTYVNMPQEKPIMYFEIKKHDDHIYIEIDTDHWKKRTLYRCSDRKQCDRKTFIK
jgi:hypothetical protein